MDGGMGNPDNTPNVHEPGNRNYDNDDPSDDGDGGS